MDFRLPRFLVPFLALFGLLLGLVAELTLKAPPVVPLACFVGGGIALACAGRMAFGRQDGVWTQQAAPMRPWEPVFFLVLVVLAVLPRVVQLADKPAGAGGYEGEMVGQLGQLDGDKNWEIYIRDGDVNWPSMVFYQQLAFFKLMKPGPVETRLPSALWGILAVLAFFFAARALLSPEAAAGASLMLAGSVYHLTISRSSFPSSIVTFAPVAAVAFLVASFRRKSWVWAAFAGAAAALGMYGYFPGRGVPGFFVIWLGLCAWALASGHRPTKAQWIAFLTACFVVSSPQIYVAFRWPHMYWDYVVSANPNQGHGLFSYFKTFGDSIGPYVAVFHIRGDSDPGMSPTLRPMLDFTQGWLFPLGLMAALCLFWRPVNAFIFGLFFAGILPAVMGGRGYAHPTTRRMVLAWPAVFLAVGLALELVRRGLNRSESKARNAWLAAAFVVAGGVSYCVNVKVYFKDYFSDPTVLNLISHDRYVIYRDHRETPDYALASSPLYSVYQTWQFYFPDTPSTALYEPEDLLRISGDQGTDAYMEPLYALTAPFLKAAIPELKISTEPTPGGPNVDRPKDPFETRWLLTRLVVPPGALARSRGMELDQKRVDVFSPGFGAEVGGKELGLRAVWLAPRQRSHASLAMAWPGFRATLDGKSFPLGRTVQLEGGMHELTLRGRAPRSAAGPLPLSATLDGADAPPLLYPMRWPYGLLATFYTGSHAWNTAPRFSRRLGASIYRFHDIGEVFLPFSIRLEGVLRAPAKGDYTFTGKPWSQMRILVNGRLVFDDMPGESPTARAVSLDPSQPAKLEIFHEGFNAGSENRAIELNWMRPGSADSEVLDPTYIETPPWVGWRPLPQSSTDRPGASRP